MACPTCGSTDVDVFLPLVPAMLCDNGWHEDRIIQKPMKTSGKAASRQRQIFRPSGFAVHYNAKTKI
jgi:hypothetical protein